MRPSSPSSHRAGRWSVLQLLALPARQCLAWTRVALTRVALTRVAWTRVALTLVALTLVACETASEPTDSALKPLDQDEDGILDAHEGAADPDGDGLANYLDTDSDGDSLPDAVEAGDTRRETFPRDSDSDGTPDFLDLDSDGNKIPDKQEVGLDPTLPLDLDRDGLPDFVDPDNDGDAISDRLELGGEVPLDSDGDGLFDYQDLDSDSDRILDRDEAGNIEVGELPRDTDQDGIADYRDLDSDNDTLSDEQEAGDKDVNTPPLDTDQDGACDAADLDADGDALTDLAELSNASDPYQYDTDGDGASDGVEYFAQSDETDARSLPQIPWVLVPQRARVTRTYTFSLLVEGADVLFLLDNTGSMSDDINALSADLLEVIEAVRAVIFNVNFGVATFQNYAGQSSNQWPFRLLQQLTSDAEAVQKTMSSLVAAGGSGSGYEALFQAMTGRGYDENCDMRLDVTFEVPPFVSEPGDAFGGTSGDRYDPADTSTGLLGGAGFRLGAYPLLVYIGDVVPNEPGINTAANVCGAPSTSRRATSSDVLAVAAATGTRIMGIYAAGDALGNMADHMTELAYASGALYDGDGDGEADEPLVFSAEEPEVMMDATISGISAAVSGGGFGEVVLELANDEYGFLLQTQPPVVQDVAASSSLAFDLTFQGAVPARSDDQIFEVTMRLIGDGATYLSERPLLIVVPGERNSTP